LPIKKPLLEAAFSWGVLFAKAQKEKTVSTFALTVFIWWWIVAVSQTLIPKS
jgi:hypothetical protein